MPHTEEYQKLIKELFGSAYANRLTHLVINVSTAYFRRLLVAVRMPFSTLLRGRKKSHEMISWREY